MINDTTVIFQGPLYPYSKDFIKEYNKHFSNVIVSTWEDQNTEDIECQTIKTKYPEFVGPGNINLQIISSLEGVKVTKTKFAIKVRSDILIKNPNDWNKFFREFHSQNKIFVLGLSKIYAFSPRDQLFRAETDDLFSLFNLSLIPEGWRNPNISNEIYPELYLGLNYYAQFSEKVKIFMNEPQNYIYQGCPLRHHVMEEWARIGTKYMYPVPRSLKYSWPKRFGDKDYNYDETALTYGEFWHEDIS